MNTKLLRILAVAVTLFISRGAYSVTLYTGGGNVNEDISYYDAASGIFLGSYPVNTLVSVDSLAFGPDGMLYLGSNGSAAISVIDPLTGIEQRSFPTQNFNANAMAFALDGTLYTGGGNVNEDISYYDAASGIFLGSYPVNTLVSVDSLAFGPDGMLYLGSNGSAAISVIDPLTGIEQRSFPTQNFNANAMAFALDGTLYTGGGNVNEDISYYDAASGIFLGSYPVNTLVSVDSLAFGPDGMLYLGSNGSAAISVIDPLTGIEQRSFPTQNFNANAMAFAPVPVPAAIWLFGSGLLGIVGMARRKKA